MGVVTQRLGETYRVDIGSAHYGTLDALAFEGATKRSKPNLKIGSLLYARVSLAHKDMDPELECFDAQTRKADGFGELKRGFVVRCSLRMCRKYVDISRCCASISHISPGAPQFAGSNILLTSHAGSAVCRGNGGGNERPGVGERKRGTADCCHCTVYRGCGPRWGRHDEGRGKNVFGHVGFVKSGR